MIQLLTVGLVMNNIPEYLLTASSDDQVATYALADWLEENNDNSLFVRRIEDFPVAIEQCILAIWDGGYFGNYGGYGDGIGYGGYLWCNRYWYTNNDSITYCGSGYE